MSLRSDPRRKVSFTSRVLPTKARAYSASHDGSTPGRSVLGRKSSIAKKEMLQKIALQAAQRNSVSNQHKQLSHRSPASIQNLTNTQCRSSKCSNTPFTPLTGLPELGDVAVHPYPHRSSQICQGSDTRDFHETPLSTANFSQERNSFPTIISTGSFRAPSAAADDICKPPAASRPSVGRLEGERPINSKLSREIDALEVEQDNAYFTVAAGSTISHAILLYYQGRGSEMTKELTQITLLAGERRNVEIMVRAQLWKAIILHEVGDTNDMPRLLGDIVYPLMQSGCSDDADFYQLRKLWPQYSDTITEYLADNYLQQFDHNLSSLEIATLKNDYRRAMENMTSFLDNGFNRMECSDPEIAANLSSAKHGQRIIRPSSDPEVKIQRLQEANERLIRENDSLKVDNVRYREERKAIPHLSTAFSKDGVFPNFNNSRLSDQLFADIARDAVSPGPVTALMKQLGQEPRHLSLSHFSNTSASPARQWLALKDFERPEASPFHQSSNHARRGSSGTTRGEYSPGYSEESFSPTSTYAAGRTYRNFSRTPNRCSRRSSSRLSHIRTTGSMSSRRSFTKSRALPSQASSSNSAPRLLPGSSSVPAQRAVKVWNSHFENSWKNLPEIFSSIDSASVSPWRHDRKLSEELSPRAIPRPPAEPQGRHSSTASFDFAIDCPSARPRPLDTSVRHPLKHSLSSPTGALDPESLPLTDTPSPTRLEAEMPQLHEHQEQRRRSLARPYNSLTSPLSTNYEHERQRFLLQCSQRGDMPGSSAEASLNASSTTNGSTRSSHDVPSPAGQVADTRIVSSKALSASRKEPIERSTVAQEVTTDGPVSTSSRLSNDTDIAETESASMSTSRGSSTCVRSSASNLPNTRGTTSVKSKRTSTGIGTGAAPLTPSSKSLSSSAVSMLLKTTSSGDNDSSSSDIDMSIGLSALAPVFNPRKTTQTEALRSRRPSQDASTTRHQASAGSEQDHFSDSPNTGERTLSKDVRISLFLSQLETEQAATLDRARRLSKPAISSPLRRISRVSGDGDDEEGPIGSAKTYSTVDPATTKGSISGNEPLGAPRFASNADLSPMLDVDDEQEDKGLTHDEERNELDDEKQQQSILKVTDGSFQVKSRTESLAVEHTASDLHKFSQEPDRQKNPEQETQIITIAKAPSISDELDVVPNSTDWQRFANGEDWRNVNKKFFGEQRQRSRIRDTHAKRKHRKIRNIPQDEAVGGVHCAHSSGRREVSRGSREANNSNTIPSASSQSCAVNREVPTLIAERWKHFSNEQCREAAQASGISKEQTLLETSVESNKHREQRVKDATLNVYGSSSDDKQDGEALSQGRLKGKTQAPLLARREKSTKSEEAQEHAVPDSGSVNSICDSDASGSSSALGIPEANEDHTRASPQPHTQCELSSSRPDTQQVLTGEMPDFAGSKKRYNSIYDEIENFYPSPTSPQKSQGRIPSQIHEYMPDSRKSHGVEEKAHDDADHASGPARSSDYGSSYSFSGFSGVYSPGIRDQQRHWVLQQQLESNSRMMLPRASSPAPQALPRWSAAGSGPQRKSDAEIEATRAHALGQLIGSSHGVVDDEAEHPGNMYVGKRYSQSSSQHTLPLSSDASMSPAQSPSHMQQPTPDNSSAYRLSRPRTRSAQLRPHARRLGSKHIVDIQAITHQPDHIVEQQSIDDVAYRPRTRRSSEAIINQDQHSVAAPILQPLTYQPPHRRREQLQQQQQDEAGQESSIYPVPGMHQNKVPRESIWENQRRAFDEEEKEGR